MNKFVLFLLAVAITACSSNRVDTIVHHAVIYTVDSAFTVVEAMAIKDGKIVATGTNDAITGKYQADSMVDAKGAALYPGLIDAHAHFMGYGASLFQVELYNTATWEETVDRIVAFAKAHPEIKFIRGRGWDQNKWPGKKYPTNELLNQRFPTTPVLIERVDGHASIANAAALELAGIQPGDKVVGGEIETKNGVLTGVMIDNGDAAVNAKIPAPTKEELTAWLQAAEKNCFAQGLTTITDCGLSHQDVDFIDGLHKNNQLNMRLYVMLSDKDANYEAFLKKGSIQNR
jgi:predicted amidohydrolase YtcJ